MSNLRPTVEAETHEKSEFSLTKALEDVSQKGHAQIVALQQKQQDLCSLQTILSDIDRRVEEAGLEVRSKERQIFTLEDKMEDLQRQSRSQQSRVASIYNHNTELRRRIDEEEENTRLVPARYDTYREKMEGHRSAVSHAASQTEAHKELEEKRALVRRLKQSKEELREDLENPNGHAVQEAKREIEDLKGERSVLRKTVAERRELLLKEFCSHTQMKKDIEIQKRRYEAIVKRLHCQLNKAQAIHRQMCGDIYYMQRQIAELKRRPKSS
ncbi:coiled-coil domain-containing protein 122 [Polymixia lowei]